MIGGRCERGIALVSVLFVLALLLGVGAAIHVSVLSETTLRGAHARSTAGFYAAEAGVNRGMGEFRRMFQSFRTPGPADLVEKSFSIGPRTVYYELSPVLTNASVRVPAGQSFGGLLAIRNSYTALSRSELTSGDAEARLGSQFDVDTIPLFQFLAFYEPDLEILPGPDMNLHGPIHTNGDLYLNAGGRFTVDDCYPATCPTPIPTVQVSAVGDVIRGRKDAVSCGGTVEIAMLTDSNGSGDLDLLEMPCGGVQSPAALASWLGSIKAGEPAVSPPAPGALAVGGGTFWQSADLRIALDLENPLLGLYPIVVLRPDGSRDDVLTARLHAFMALKPGRIFYNDVPIAGRDQDLACGAPNSYCNPLSYPTPFPLTAVLYPCPGSDLGLYGACALGPANSPLGGGLVTGRRGGFYNNRENAWVYMLNVNVHDLLAWNRAQGVAAGLFDPDDTSAGGVVLFLTVRGPGSVGPISSPRYGVRVFGSPHLNFPAGIADPTGLTVVTDQALYVEGDYNVGTGPNPKQPAALIGDTINVLSTAWTGAGGCRNDCQSRKPLGLRPLGTDTAIFSAFLGGVDTTTVGNYNGGLENYPRFHEDWSGRTLFYRGSFVAFGEPQRANGPWCGTGGGCNIYSPPGRNWDFDPDFMTAERLPPMTPSVVTVKQVIFAEDFR